MYAPRQASQGRRGTSLLVEFGGKLQVCTVNEQGLYIHKISPLQKARLVGIILAVGELCVLLALGLMNPSFFSQPVAGLVLGPTLIFLIGFVLNVSVTLRRIGSARKVLEELPAAPSEPSFPSLPGSINWSQISGASLEGNKLLEFETTFGYLLRTAFVYRPRRLEEFKALLTEKLGDRFMIR